MPTSCCGRPALPSSRRNRSAAASPRWTPEGGAACSTHICEGLLSVAAGRAAVGLMHDDGLALLAGARRLRPLRRLGAFGVPRHERHRATAAERGPRGCIPRLLPHETRARHLTPTATVARANGRPGRPAPARGSVLRIRDVLGAPARGLGRDGRRQAHLRVRRPRRSARDGRSELPDAPARTRGPHRGLPVVHLATALAKGLGPVGVGPNPARPAKTRPRRRRPKGDRAGTAAEALPPSGARKASRRPRPGGDRLVGHARHTASRLSRSCATSRRAGSRARDPHEGCAEHRPLPRAVHAGARRAWGT